MGAIVICGALACGGGEDTATSFASMTNMTTPPPGSTSEGSHAGPEAVGALTTNVVRLIGTLHSDLLVRNSCG